MAKVFKASIAALLLDSALFAASESQKASAYRRGNANCDHGRKFLCKFCGESCGQARCPPDPKPEDFQFPEDFPDCNWGCYCPDGKIWSPMHNDCLEGDYDKICTGPGYYTYKVIPTFLASNRMGSEVTRMSRD